MREADLKHYMVLRVLKALSKRRSLHGPQKLGLMITPASRSSAEAPMRVSSRLTGTLIGYTERPKDVYKRQVNTFPGLVHTARHTMGVGSARSRYPNLKRREPSKVRPMTGVKS